MMRGTPRETSQSTILVSTWADGVVGFDGRARFHERQKQKVKALARDGNGGVFAVIDEHELWWRDRDQVWSRLVDCPWELSCALAIGDDILLGTEDARLFLTNSNGELKELSGLQETPGREQWYAGQVVIDGVTLGPPLGIRSMTVTANKQSILVNPHVGGIARSTDYGETWSPTIDIDHDVHQVLAHPTDPNRVIAASAIGFCRSYDGGATWKTEATGLHAPYCSAVAFAKDDALVAASDHHFADEGGLYRLAERNRAAPVTGTNGLPPRLEGIVDTRCLVSKNRELALVDKGGTLYYSSDLGRHWQCIAAGLLGASSVVFI